MPVYVCLCDSLLQVFFRFVMEIGGVPLTGTKSLVHMKEALAAQDLKLSVTDVGQLRAAIGI